MNWPVMIEIGAGYDVSGDVNATATLTFSARCDLTLTAVKPDALSAVTSLTVTYQ